MHGSSGQRVEVGGQGGDQGLALAGLHLGDVAFVQDDAADELYVEMAQADAALARLPDQGERLGQNVVQAFVPGDPLPEFGGFLRERRIRQLGIFLLKGVDVGDRLAHALEDAFVTAAEYLCNNVANHDRCRWILGLVQRNPDRRITEDGPRRIITG